MIAAEDETHETRFIRAKGIDTALFVHHLLVITSAPTDAESELSAEVAAAWLDSEIMAKKIRPQGREMYFRLLRAASNGAEGERCTPF